jgi:hypothetical protein
MWRCPLRHCRCLAVRGRWPPTIRRRKAQQQTNTSIMDWAIHICPYGSMCRMASRVFLKIRITRENSAFILLDPTMSEPASYCGPDTRIWSAPVEDLSAWRDEGPIFTYKIGNQWDVMYAPDLVEVKGKDGKKVYYLYPHSRGGGRSEWWPGVIGRMDLLPPSI